VSAGDSAPPLSTKTTRRARRGFLDRWFEPIQVPRGAGEELQAHSARGSLVFVMRSSGLLNFLYLRWLLRRLRLPLLRSAANFSGFWGWVARIRRTRRSLLDAASRGRSALVFLGRPDGARDPLAALAGLQRNLHQPVFLVPVILVWSRRAQKLKPSLWDILFGSPEAPSTFATAIAFLRNYRRAVLRVGRPLDLKAFVAERLPEPDELLGRKVRGALYHHLTRELRAALGPPLKAPARMREKVLRDRSLRQVLEHVSRARGKPLGAMAEEALKDLREIASRYSPAFIEFVRPLLGWFFNRRFERLEVDEEGLARVRQAAGEAPLVLCPSHKSHVDYLLLSYVFYENGMTPPHVAAGVNLAFWPFGGIARRGGAFFIRRTFKGDKIYSATLRAYVKHLMRDRFVQEFFPEGGRSRTGKLLFLKTGLFSMEVDAWLDGAADDVLFVPIAVDYEELLETKSLLHELSGGEKRKESFRALLGLARFLVRRYGRIYIQFEKPISLRTLAQERLGEAAGSLTLEPEERETDSKRSLVRALSNRVAYGINRAITITPIGLVATALLSHVHRGIPSEVVAQRAELLRYVARDSGARFASGLAGAPSDPCKPGPIADAVATLVQKGLVRVEEAAGQTIYQVPDEKRAQLDINRNNVIHRFVAVSLIAAALRASGGDAPVSIVRDRTRWLSRLFKLEFMYRVGATFEIIFAENVAFLERLGILSRAGESLRAGAQRDLLDFVADLTRAYLEAYRLVAETLQVASAKGAPLDRKTLVKDALERGRAAFLSGRIALRESVSKATIENASEWFSQQGAVSFVDGRWTLSQAWKDQLLTELVDEMDRHLRV
jgi:glycerol-3-phosphate O-acyltransferase